MFLIGLTPRRCYVYDRCFLLIFINLSIIILNITSISIINPIVNSMGIIFHYKFFKTRAKLVSLVKMAPVVSTRMETTLASASLGTKERTASKVRYLGGHP